MLYECTLSLLHVALIMRVRLFTCTCIFVRLRELMSFAVEGVAFDSHPVCIPATSIKQSCMFGQ